MRREKKNRIFSVSPQSRSLFSASFQTFCLTARTYLNTQKYGLFCSLRTVGFFLSPHTPYGRVRLARFARVRLLRHALPISLLIFRKKPTVLQSRTARVPIDLSRTRLAVHKQSFLNLLKQNSRQTNYPQGDILL